MVNLNVAQDVFVEWLPALKKTAQMRFRHLSPEARQEAVQNTLGLTWKFYYALVRQGRAEEPTILTACVRYAARQTKVGRSIQGGKQKDLLARGWNGPARMDDFNLDYFISRTTPVFDQVVFRIDVPDFLDTLTDRQRQIAIDLAMNKGTREVAAKYGVTAAAISQFRVRFKKWYDQFFAD